MIRYVCDNCGKTVDNEIPKAWETVQVSQPAPGESGLTRIVGLHLCEDHNAEDLIHGLAHTAEQT